MAQNKSQSTGVVKFSGKRLNVFPIFKRTFIDGAIPREVTEQRTFKRWIKKELKKMGYHPTKTGASFAVTYVDDGLALIKVKHHERKDLMERLKLSIRTYVHAYLQTASKNKKSRKVTIKLAKEIKEFYLNS